jgi:hypothetical protein
MTEIIGFEMDNEMRMIVSFAGRQGEQIVNPSPEEIDEAVGLLLPMQYSLVQIMPEKPVSECEFIQAMLVLDERHRLQYQVRVHMTYQKEGEAFIADLYNVELVKRILRLYCLGIAPDVSNNDRN